MVAARAFRNEKLTTSPLRIHVLSPFRSAAQERIIRRVFGPRQRTQAHPGELLLLISWRDAAVAARWHPPAVIGGAGQVRNRLVRIIRDYGMSERREAPQYYPDVKHPDPK
jgi:hypothetical protein